MTDKEIAEQYVWRESRRWRPNSIYKIDYEGYLLPINSNQVQRGDYITACPRMKKALELCGCETVKLTNIVGIERFCKL